MSDVDRDARREHLEGLLGELREQRKVDVDQVLMELIHFVFELDDDLRNLNARVSELKRRV
jgi:hypothetical protein